MAELISHSNNQTHEEIRAFWTAKRRDESEPITLPIVDRLPQPPKSSGAPVHRDAVQPEELDASAGDSSGFTTAKVSDMSDSPYQYVGKLYMTFNWSTGSKNYTGSAFCIAKCGIITAGHCLYGFNPKNSGESMWASNVHFKGRYDNGSDKGDWSMPHLAAPANWINNHDFACDMAAAVSNSNIASKIGHAGWMANQSVDQGSYDSVGYPAREITDYDFDGKYMWHCQGEFQSGNTSNIQMCNNMTEGCSGGPWSVLLSNGKHRMNGLNSFRYSSEPDSMYSPYFGDDFVDLTNWIDNNSSC